MSVDVRQICQYCHGRYSRQLDRADSAVNMNAVLYWVVEDYAVSAYQGVYQFLL